MGAGLAEEVLLVRGLGIAVPGRKHHPLHPEGHHLVEELPRPQRRGAVEEGGVGGHPEAAPQGLLDPVHRLVEDAVAAHRLVVLLAQAVHVHAEGQVLGRSEEIELLLEKDGIRAEVDVLPTLDQLDDQLVDVGVHQRLAARNAHDGRAALLHGLETLIDGQVLFEDLRGVLDLAAAGAREVAPEERLEHENERISLATPELLLDDVARDRGHLGNRDAHRLRNPLRLSRW